jgi:DNA polymerase-4
VSRCFYLNLFGLGVFLRVTQGRISHYCFSILGNAGNDAGNDAGKNTGNNGGNNMSEAAGADGRAIEFVCRACLASGYLGGINKLTSCLQCGSPRIVAHEELFSLTIAHLDCDAFYASVEKRDNPDLHDKPVIVGGGSRGVVAAACYIARQYGIRSAMPSWQAKRACPELIIIKPRMAHYSAVGSAVREAMSSLTPLVEPLSIDEAFLDLSGTNQLHRKCPAEALAALQQTILKDVGITVSVGLAANKSLAKIASDQDKPDGFYVIGAQEAPAWLADKPVNILFGMGKTSTARLAAENIQTCGQLLAAPEYLLKQHLGRDAGRITALARGEDRRPVTPHRAAKSISSETTFSHDISDKDELIAIADTLILTVSRRLKQKDLYGGRITLKLKQTDHRILTRSAPLSPPTDKAHRILDEVITLLSGEVGSRKFYRLLGVGVDALQPAGGAGLLDLMDEGAQKQDSLEQALDQLYDKHGDAAIISGRRFAQGYVKPTKK